MVKGVESVWDTIYATGMLENLATVAVLAGDNQTAISTLEKLLAMPGNISRAYLRVHPLYEPLRTDPRFKALIAGN
jgi:serine/threonine-protein kinase